MYCTDILAAEQKLSLERLEKSNSESRAEIQSIVMEQDRASLKKGAQLMEHIEQINRIFACFEELDEAEARRIEADSDVHALRERNHGIVENLNMERTRLAEIEEQSKRATETARTALTRCKEVKAAALARNDNEAVEFFSNIPENLTVENLRHQINSEEHKLQYIQANNPMAIRDYKKRQDEIKKLSTRITGTEGDLGDVARKVTEIMAKWEPRLDALIEQISQAFSYNFEQIGCAGEVGVYKEEDFEKWAIEIKVKFRYSLIFLLTFPLSQKTNIKAEKTKLSSSSTSTDNLEESALSLRFSTSCLYNHWLDPHSASSMRSIKEWILVTNEWSMDVWLILHVRNIPVNISSLRQSYFMI